MIVIAESNFVLEIALHQDEAEHAEWIVARTEAKSIELVVPAFALAEPHETLIRRRKERNVLLDRLRGEISQLARSQEFAHLGETSRDLTKALATSAASQAKDFDATVRRLAGCAIVPELSAPILVSALQVQIEFDLQPQDAIIFASVDEYLKTSGAGPKWFVSKDAAAFGRPDVVEHFGQLGCKVATSLGQARGEIEAELTRCAEQAQST